jgi:membrane protein YdbS with pleckstrin-like domain
LGVEVCLCRVFRTKRCYDGVHLDDRITWVEPDMWVCSFVMMVMLIFVAFIFVFFFVMVIMFFFTMLVVIIFVFMFVMIFIMLLFRILDRIYSYARVDDEYTFFC